MSLAVLSVLLICSCKDDDEVVLSSDCYISSFTLGNVKRQITTVNSAGRDTTYTISYSASYFPMTVNQLDGTIANKDSLPVNSDVKAVLATVESSGTVVYKKVSEGEDAWKAYSTSDSIDFTSPLTFRVYSPDYSASRDYTLQVNVHQQDGEVFSWEKSGGTGSMVDCGSGKDGGVERIRMAVQPGEWRCACVLRQLLADGKKLDPNGPCRDVRRPMCRLLVVFGNELYVSGVDGTLMRSEDGLNWSVCAADRSVRLLVADRTHLYALSDGRVWRSADGALWLKKLWTKRRLSCRYRILQPSLIRKRMAWSGRCGLATAAWTIIHQTRRPWCGAIVWPQGRKRLFGLISMPRRTTVILVPVCNP